MNTITPRKWTATISVGGYDVSDMLEYPNSDTLREVERAAIALATQCIRVEEMGSDASIVLHKQLRNAPRVSDRTLYVYRDWNGNGDAVIRVQR